MTSLASPAPAASAAAPFVGRKAELSELRELLATRRLVTLTGTGGCGKTRLALEFLQNDPVGGWVVLLASLRHPAEVDRAILRALDARSPARVPPLQAAVAALERREGTILLDNCEHVVEAAAGAAAALLHAPRIRIMATSRLPLGVDGETVWRVPPLSLSSADGDTGSDAVRLFLDRARLVRQDLDPADDAIPAICRALDGLPLAIELAAARARALPPRAIAELLRDRFRILTGGPRGRPAHQQTMRASLDWSFALLTPAERTLLGRLSVFSGGFTLDAAEAVCGDPRLDVLETLTGLVDHSLVSAGQRAGEAWFEMLETVRQYAAERLEDVAALRVAHRQWFVELAERARREQWVLDPHKRALLEAHTANFRLALEDACTAASSDALALAGDLAYFWVQRSWLREAREACERALMCAAAGPSELRAQTLAMLGMVAWQQGDYEFERPVLESAAEHAENAHAPQVLARVLQLPGALEAVTSHPRIAVRLYQRSTALARECGERVVESDALASTALMRLFLDEDDALLAEGQQALELCERVGTSLGALWGIWALGQRACLVGELHHARRLADRGLAAGAATAGSTPHNLLVALRALIEVMEGHPGRARELVKRELESSRNDPTFLGIGGLWHTHALAELAAGDTVRALDAAARITGAGEAIWWTRLAEELHMLIALARRDGPGARRHAQALEEVGARLSNPTVSALACLGRARAALLENDDLAAEQQAHEALAIFVEKARRPAVLDALETIAAVAAYRGATDEAARVLGAAASARRALGLAALPLPGPLAAPAGLRQGGAYREGNRLSLDEAVALVRRGRGARSRGLRGWGSLTPAEREVADLAALGLSNPEIAQRLFMARDTVKAHLKHIYAKLGVANRTGLAALVASRRLSG